MSTVRHRRTLLRGGAAALAAGGVLVLAGCGGTEGPQAGAEVINLHTGPAVEPGAGPVLDEFTLDEIRSFVGQRVTVTGEVGVVTASNAFTVLDEANHVLLVVYDGTPRNLQPGTGIRVTGTVHKSFRIDTAGRFAGAKLNQDKLGGFQRQPYLRASSVKTDVTLGNAGGG